MGLSVTLYALLAMSGLWVRVARVRSLSRPAWLGLAHVVMGSLLVALVILLLAVGVVGTLGYYGDLGHSVHLPAGLIVVGLTLASAWSASRILAQQPWARSLHITLNLALLLGFALVSATGWSVVQKYLP